MAYVTISNSRKIIRRLDENKLEGITEQLYKWDIYFFNKKESAILKGIRELLRDPANFMLCYYEPIEVKDSLHYVFPESQPAYHKNDACIKLHSNFRNFEIPIEIRNKGKEEVIRFRDLFNGDNWGLLEPKQYIFKLQARFPYVGEINPRSIDYSNSGSKEVENLTLYQLENKIDELLREAGSFFKNNIDKQHIIRRFQKLTFLAYVDGPLYNNDSGLTDEELKSFLREYDEKFKAPVKHYLSEFYRMKFNPEMTFEGQLLEKIGFKPCYHCFNNNHSESPGINTIEDNDNLPF